MALKSAQIGRAATSPRRRSVLASSFLDSVQSEDGARYGYMTTEPRNTHHGRRPAVAGCSPAGSASNPGAGAGRGAISCEWGPSKDDIYFDYYATQVLFHWEGSDWVRWNQRDARLPDRQPGQLGARVGQLVLRRTHGDTGGRLFSTAMAVMTLEVYYRYMPIYAPIPLD